MNNIKLIPLQDSDREQFISDNQEAFNYGALEEFGRRDDHFEENEQIISRETIERSIDNGEAYCIMLDNRPVGGVIISVDGEKGDLVILFTSPKDHSKGVGNAAWCEVEKLHPEVKIWETVTTYFEKRNIHFYVNRCGFHIVEFYNNHHPDPNDLNGDHMWILTNVFRTGCSDLRRGYNLTLKKKGEKNDCGKDSYGKSTCSSWTIFAGNRDRRYGLHIRTDCS